MEDEKWLPLNGCNACINSCLCGELGNCGLLNIDLKYPANTRTKRKLITRLRSVPISNRVLYVREIIRKEKLLPEQPKVKPVKRLTVFEEMCIKELKKPR